MNHGSSLGFLHLIEVDIDVMRIVLLGKTLHGESLPALTDSLDDEGLPGRILFSVLKDGFNLTFEHITLFQATFQWHYTSPEK